jgi:arylsulfatase
MGQTGLAMAAAVVVTSAFLGEGCGVSRSIDLHPNVLLVTVDTLRADYLGIYGSKLGASPNIDGLGRKGMVFERAIAAAPNTAPSHASIMTSRYVREHSIGYQNGYSRLLDETRLAEVFQSAGYATGAFVSNIVLQPLTGLDRGFEVFDSDLPNRELNRETMYERIAEETNERALAWLDEQRDSAYFLWVHYQDPHGPYDPPPSYLGRFSVPPPLDEKPLPVVAKSGGWNSIPSYLAVEGANLPSQYMSRYADEIFYTDHAFGELLRAVDSQSSDRDTIVLFSSDHGESMGESERYFTHGFATTPQLAHVPMILRAPGLLPGRWGAPVSHVDVMPTLLNLAGIETPAGMSGLALGPYLKAGQPLPERMVYCDNGRELSAYRGESFVRVQGLQFAWQRQESKPKPAWLGFRWQEDGTWSLVEMDEASREPIERYFNDAVRIELQPGKSSDEIQMLELLGYVREEDEH